MSLSKDTKSAEELWETEAELTTVEGAEPNAAVVATEFEDQLIPLKFVLFTKL